MDPIFFMDKGGLPLKKALNSDARLLQSILLELSIHFRRVSFSTMGKSKRNAVYAHRLIKLFTSPIMGKTVDKIKS